MHRKGSCPPRIRTKAILWSGLASFLGILAIGYMFQWVTSISPQGLLVIGSFGASATLLYGVPFSDFSQPRNLIGGHILSAIVGVSSQMILGHEIILAASIAVACSIMGMHFTRTMHPPGGATALIAVMGGESIHRLGFLYVVKPVLLGCISLLVIALLVNNLSRNPDRHYPKYWIS